MSSKSRRRKRRPPDPLPALENRLKSALGRDVPLVYSPAGVEKMSEVIQRFIAPYMPFVHNLGDMERLVTTALVAWNAALLPSAERAAMLARSSESVRKLAGREAEEDFRIIVDEMMQRKQRYFPEIKRFVIDFTVTDEGNQFRLTVVSSLTPKDIAPRSSRR